MNQNMKNFASFTALFILTALACTSCMYVTAKPPVSLTTRTALPPAAEVPSSTPEPATPTPEIFISLTQAVPGEFQPAGEQTTVSYSPLTFTIPPRIADGASMLTFPRLDSDDAAWWEKTPGHLQVSLADTYLLQGKTHQPAIYVYPALAYAELLPPAFESIHRLDNFLYAPNNIPALSELPGVPFFNTQILFASQIQQVNFQNGSGIRYVTEYAQYAAPANNTDLFYTFIGLTTGGEWYVVAVFPLTSPVLAETSDAGAPLPERGLAYPTDPAANMAAYYIGITDLLNAQLPESFTPHLAELDQLIQSMRIEP